MANFRGYLVTKICFVSVLIVNSSLVRSQNDSSHPKDSDRVISLHGQMTVIPQYHFDFHAPYSGTNSLANKEPVRTSLTSTFYFAWRPFHHTYLVFNPELAAGKGLSGTTGVAGFPNGEIYRVGDPNPHLFLARLYLEQRFPLSKKKIWVDDDLNQIQGKQARDYFSISVGKFSITDFFDNSDVSHDPREDLLNWSLMDAAAWDYPANTRGYTEGLVLQLYYKEWFLKMAETAEASEMNGPNLEYRFSGASGSALELGRKIPWGKNATVFHLGGFLNRSNSFSYDQVLDQGQIQNPLLLRSYGKVKYGWYVLADNYFGHLKNFIRLSWNDGKTSTWTFTEIDRSLATGIVFNGGGWSRASDKVSIGGVINAISQEHRRFLEAGGIGFIVGDGKLNYAPEEILELNYLMSICRKISLSADYQYVRHPAYNLDRGPVSIISFRFHVEI